MNEMFQGSQICIKSKLMKDFKVLKLFDFEYF